MSLLDENKLKSYLSEKLEAENLSVTNIWKNLEGWSMETYSIGLSYLKGGSRVEEEIIIRKQPAAGLHDYDVFDEYRLITALNKTEIPVPETFWFEADPDVLGSPFYTMEKVEGKIPMPPISTFDPDFYLYTDDEERLIVADDFVKNLALIHNTDWKILGLDFMDVPKPGKDSALKMVEYWENRIVRAGFRNRPEVAYAVDWLKDNLVENDHVSIIHGDYRSGNFIIRDKRIVTILDWEGARLGDPMDDIAYVTGGGFGSAPPRSWVSHLLPADEFISRYEEASGIKVDMGKLEYYKMMNQFRSIAVPYTAAGSWRSKPDLDLKVGVFGMLQYVGYMALVGEFYKYHKPPEGA
jgi:aminoglycoside phosphotransferase (APT) family kinase protein